MPAHKPSDIEIRIKRADDSFQAGKKGYQEGRLEDARREFNRAIETLLNAPENVVDRQRLERRLEELVQAIYRYDVDGLGAGESDDEDKVAYDKSPRDEILEMTFPIDPRLKSKVKEEIMATASQLPLEENDAVVSYINFFSTERGRRILISGLRRAGRYREMIRNVLAEQGLPQELIYLAQIESGFLPRAMSNKRCVGLWQFAKFRGNEYGLRQSAATDDRMDPERATRAAARHLRDLYQRFGDWYLAMSAYNCGPGCVDRAVTRTGYADFWTLRRLNALPRETVNYVPVILAITIMAKNAKDYRLENLDLDRPVQYDSIELTAPTNVALIADALDRPVSEIRELNPGLLKSVAPDGYALRVPKGTTDQLRATLEMVPASRRASWRVHRVGQGETLASIARRFGTSASVITAANHDGLPDAGGLLVIPASYQPDRPVMKQVKKKTTAKGRKHPTTVARKTRARPAHRPMASALRPGS